MVILDSAAMIHLFPVGFDSQFGLKKSKNCKILGAGGREVVHHGQREVDLNIDGQNLKITSEVAEVSRPILSAAKLVERGYEVVLARAGSYIKHQGARRTEARGEAREQSVPSTR